jgi:predicted 3-demethylubiquinone-9 3-methyltransferase (glyoxalase superfamily)
LFRILCTLFDGEGEYADASPKREPPTLHSDAAPSPLPHPPAASRTLFIHSPEDEINRLYESLSASGNAFMPIGDYGFSRKFAWLSDRFGVSWQLNLA